MKKVILALAIVSVSFAACNNGDEAAETPAVDTMVAPVEAPVAPVDTTTAAPAADTTATPAAH